jgi:hypothetical protein
MRLVALFAGAVFSGVLSATPIRAADSPRDAADLFPAQTLVYLEFRQPERLSRESAALLRGSVLDDMPATLARIREKHGDNDRFFFEDMIVGYLSMFASPEMVAEFGRLGGGAVGITGFTKDREPEVVGIILSGTSNAPTFFMRTFLTVDPSIRKVDECESVTLYREKERIFRKGAPAPATDYQGPTYALLREGLIIGSTTDSVKEMIRRFKGKTSEPALASVASFRDSAALRDKPGLFGYADLGALNIQLEESMKTASPPVVLEWNKIKALVNPKAGRRATLSLNLQNGSVELLAHLGLENNESCALLDVLPDKKANLDLLQFVPRDAAAAFTLALSDGEQRWSKVLALVDAAASADGRRAAQLPSKQVTEIETNLKLKFGKDIFAKLMGMAIAVEPLQEGKIGPSMPLLIFAASDTAAAKELEEQTLPKLANLLGPGATPKIETIQGQRIAGLPLPLFGPQGQVFVGRQGKTLVFGENGKRVALALTGGAKKEGLLGQANAAAALRDVGDSSIVGVVSLGGLLPLVLPHMERSQALRAPVPPGGIAPAPPRPMPPDALTLKLARDLAKLTESLPPGVVTLQRKPEELTLICRQPNLRAVSARLVSRVIETSVEQLLGGGQQNGPAGGAIPPPAPKN